MKLSQWIPSLALVLGIGLPAEAIDSVGKTDKASISKSVGKDVFIDSLISEMTIEDLVLQLHLMFADDIVGKNSHNEIYDETMRFSPKSPIGVMHDWYPMNSSYFNSVQQLQFDRSHIKVPMMLVEECLHGVGSFKQSMFPQNIGMAASWDIDIVYRVGRAIATEARSIGIHGCFSPVLDLGQDPRWGRMQEAFGEDKILTSHMGVAYSSGLSKNGSWDEPDAVYPIMKHFAAHGAPQSGRNAAPYTGHGPREILEDMLVPFKASYELGGARGVMMAYNEIDGVPAAVHPMLYGALEDWGFDGFTLADDTCIRNLLTQHAVTDSQADAMRQWYNAGGMIDFYDWDLESHLNVTKDLVANHSVPLKTLQSHVKKILSVKWDTGLFENPFIPEGTEPLAIVQKHQNVALEAARKSIVLLKNDNDTLPLKKTGTTIALIGPFADTVNFGDYSGALGQYPMTHAQTVREGMLASLNGSQSSASKIRCSWGTNSWEYNNQYGIPPYLLSSNGSIGGLKATYFSDTNFSKPVATRIETPVLDWGLNPPPGLPRNNFSVIWEGELISPVDVAVKGWIGVGVGANTTAKLLIDGDVIQESPYTDQSNILGNIQGYDFTQENKTLPPQGGSEFTFEKGAVYHVRIEYQAWDNYKKTANVNSINSQAIFWWNLVEAQGQALEQAISVAKHSDVIVLAVGAAWNSDGESGDRGTLGLAPSQDALARAMYELGKPVVLVLQGGRPFAIPDHYKNASAVLSTFFGGQAAGQAIADVLFGTFNPGGKMPMTVPYDVAQLPVYYNYRPTAKNIQYLDIPSDPVFSFGYGLSYTTFSASSFSASVQGDGGRAVRREDSDDDLAFAQGDTIEFNVKVRNNGTVPGSYVAQVYLLGRVSAITQPVKQLVAFERVYLDAGEEGEAVMRLEVDRYLMILNRRYQWELEKGSYTFGLLQDGGSSADTAMNITMNCAGGQA